MCAWSFHPTTTPYTSYAAIHHIILLLLGGGFGGGHGGGYGAGYGGGYGAGGFPNAQHHHYYYNNTGNDPNGGGSCNGQNNCNGIGNGIGNHINGTNTVTRGFDNSTRLADEESAVDLVELDDEPEPIATAESSKTAEPQKAAVTNAPTAPLIPPAQGYQNYPAFIPIFPAQIAYVPQQQQPQQQQQQSTTKSAKPEIATKDPDDNAGSSNDANKIIPSNAAPHNVQPENSVVSTLSPTPTNGGLVSNFVLNPAAQLNGNGFVQVPSSYLPNNGVQSAGAGFVSNLVLNPAITAESPSKQNTANAPTKANPNKPVVRKPQSDTASTEAKKPSTERAPSVNVQPVFSGGSCNGKNNCNKI